MMMIRFAALVVALSGAFVSSSTTINADVTQVSRRFDGVGGLSGGGATSNLLRSYPEQMKSDLLDLLFKPNHVASLDILKVEIGGDAQSTDGCESSHQHTADETPNFNRGYENWLMKEAKARNPNIKLYGLPWAWPGWIGDSVTKNPYINVSLPANYVTTWVKGMKEVHDLHIDWVGIWNERSYTADYIETLRSTLDKAGFSDTQIVAHDAGWDIATAMLSDPALDDVVDVIGVHYPGSHSTSDAEATGKPLWASEDMSTANSNRGSQCWAKILNQNYVVGNQTATISWNLIASYYHGLPWYSTALMTATEPWSGHYDDVNVAMMWVTAHTTHFTEPGWMYLSVGSGSGILDGGGSVVALTDQNGNVTFVIEKMAWDHSQCIRPSTTPYSTTKETVTFNLLGSGFVVPSTLRVYKTTFTWEDDKQTHTDFQRQPDITVTDNSFTIEVNPDELYTITSLPPTTAGTFPENPASAPFPVPYSDNFDSYPESSEAAYFADQAGIWEVQKAEDSSRGNVMRQMVPMHPISWQNDYAPFSVIGDTQWSDVTTSVDIYIEEGIAFLGARVRTCCTPSGVYVSLDAQTHRYVLSTNFETATSTSASTSSPGWIGGGMADVYPNKWYTVKLVVKGDKTTGYLNGVTLFSSATIPGVQSTGWVAIGTGSDPAAQTFQSSRFDNFDISEAAPLVCPPARAGKNLTTQWCNGANNAATLWNIPPTSTGGQISLKANSSLCVTLDEAAASLQVCNADNPSQQFSFTAVSTLPGYYIGTANGLFLDHSFYPDNKITTVQAGLEATACDSSKESQRFKYDESSGQIVDSAGNCLTGYCSDISKGCEPIKAIDCTSGDKNIMWTHNSDGSFQNAGSNGCMDLWHTGAGPGVGVYECDGNNNQAWTVDASSQRIQSHASGDRCLDSDGAPSGNGLMVNEFVVGQITPYGPAVTDYCMSVCL